MVVPLGVTTDAGTVGVLVWFVFRTRSDGFTDLLSLASQGNVVPFFTIFAAHTSIVGVEVRLGSRALAGKG